MKKHKHISIRSYILITVLIMVALSLSGASAVSFILVKTRLELSRIRSLEADCENLAESLQKDSLENVSSDEMGLRVDDLADFKSGRIMVLSRNYKVLRDSQGDVGGELIINSNLMNVMTGKQDRYIKNKNANVIIIVPVKSEDRITGAIIASASMEELYGHLNSEFIVISIIVLLIFIVDIIVCTRIARSATGDLEDINDQMAHTSQGNLQEKMPSQKFAETQMLVENYNNILTRLATIDQTRSEFVSNVSHELKTPITSMKVLAESITQNEGASAEDYKEFMTDIVDEIDRETKIINDLLTLVKTDSQNNQMNFEEHSINEMMETIIKTVRPLANQRNINLSYESYRDVMADIDQVKLALAISNLVENAVKYNVENGWIRCSLNEDHKYFYIKVADSGVGIPDDAKDKVFDRFYRVDKARSRDTGGTGLGLSITRSIINAHRGTIKLYSEAGKGTTFTVRIPLKQDSPKVKVQENVTSKKNGVGVRIIDRSIMDRAKDKEKAKDKTKDKNKDKSKNKSKEKAKEKTKEKAKDKTKEKAKDKDKVT